MKRASGYEVVFAEGAFDEGSDALAAVLRKVTGAERPRVMLVADMNVVQHTQGLGRRIGAYMQAHGLDLAGQPVVIPGGEKAKFDDMRGALRVAAAAVESMIGPDGCMLVLGGGSILDVAGWAAAQLGGGVKVVRMPTTVAAMLDAAYADNAALDLAEAKDALRVPAAPSAVVVDVSFASTVLDGVWRAGYSEAVRIATVCDAALARRLADLAEGFKSRSREALDETVRAVAALRGKKGDTGFAQWAALRLEAMSGYKLPHGYAVAIGIALDTAYAQLRGLMSSADRDIVCGTLEGCGAMDGAQHSRHLLSRADAVLQGLETWRFVSKSGEIAVPKGLGRHVSELPDIATMKQALDMLK